MSFAVIHMEKYKANAVKGMQIHNQREKESETNPDIQKDKSHLNYDLENEKEIDYTEKINSMIEERVDQSKRKVRKDAVRLASFLVTSDKEFFDRIGEREEKRFFKTARQFVADRYGEKNMVYSSVHKDEKTPHMHVGIVPITEDNRLSAKHFFGKKQQLHKLQDDFHTHMKEHGFDLERGVSSDRKHLDTARYKLQTTQEKTKELEKNLEKLKTVETKINEIDDIDKKTKEIPLAKQIVISKSDFEEIKVVAKYGVAIRQNYEELKESNSIQTKEYQERIKMVEQERDAAMDSAERKEKEADTWKQKYENLSSQYNYLRNELNRTKEVLQNVISRVRENAKQFVQKFGGKKVYKEFQNEVLKPSFDSSMAKYNQSVKEQEGFDLDKVKKENKKDQDIELE